MLRRSKKAMKLVQKTAITLKKEGMGAVINKTKIYIERRKNFKHRNHYRDILFINGCSLEHPSRYRVTHQIEQLEFVGYSCDEIWYENLTMDMLKFYRGFIFYRCPSTPLILDFIDKAKSYNKTTFFDIDDLVIDEKYTKTIKYVNEMSKEDYDVYMDGVNRMQETLRHCDYGITTTKTLKRELENYISEVYINRNVSSEKMLKISEDVLKEKEKLNAKSKKENKTNYRLKIEEIFEENLNIRKVDFLSNLLEKILTDLKFSATDENYKTLISYIILLQSKTFHDEINNFICVDGTIIKDWDEYRIIKEEIKNQKLDEIFNEQDIFIITDLIVGITSYNKVSQFYENWIESF